MPDWFRLALSPATVRRALTHAVVIGAVVIGIDHGAALLHGQLDRARLLRMGLVLLALYVGSTIASVTAPRDRRMPQRKQRETAERRISKEA